MKFDEEENEILSRIERVNTKLSPGKIASCILHPDQIYKKNKEAIQFILFFLLLWMFGIGQASGFYLSGTGKFMFSIVIAAGPVTFLWVKFVAHTGWFKSIVTGLFTSFIAAALFMLFMTTIFGFVVLMTTVKGDLSIMELIAGN